MNESLNILREQLKFREKFLKETEGSIQTKKAQLDQLEGEKSIALAEIADMKRAISFLDRVQHDT